MREDGSGRLAQVATAPTCALAGARRQEHVATLSGAVGDSRGTTCRVQGSGSQGQGAHDGRQASKEGGEFARADEAPEAAPIADTASTRERAASPGIGERASQAEAPGGAHSQDPAATVEAAVHVASAALAAGVAALAREWPGRQTAAKEASAILAKGRAEEGNCLLYTSPSPRD